MAVCHAFRKRNNNAQAMHPHLHPLWMERTNEGSIHATTMDQLRKFKPTAQRVALDTKKGYKTKPGYTSSVTLVLTLAPTLTRTLT